jgi:DNA-binding NarL/FixJ family response regulator
MRLRQRAGVEHESHLPSSHVVRIRMHDPVLARAVEAVVVDAGWEVGRNGGGLVVADAVAAGEADVVVVPPTPATCRDAVGAASSASVVVTDRLDELPDALDAARRGYVLVPRRVHALAESLPPLGRRERRVLEAVMAGQANVQIARSLGISVATVKRAVATLVVRLGAARREELTAVALELGFRPAPARP